MIIWARQSMTFLMSRNTIEIIIGTAMLSLVGVVAETGTLVLMRRRWKHRALPTEGLSLALIFLLFCLSDWALLWILCQETNHTKNYRDPLFGHNPPPSPDLSHVRAKNTSTFAVCCLRL